MQVLEALGNIVGDCSRGAFTQRPAVPGAFDVVNQGYFNVLLTDHVQLSLVLE